MPKSLDDQILDALLTLGYAVDISDKGAIVATKGDHKVTGKMVAKSGAISWGGDMLDIEQKVLLPARIAELRQRMSKHGKADS
jgi:hypothetical protein